MPKPRSSGSATNAPRRRLSPVPDLRSSALGFFSSCQFFALTAMFIPWQLGAEVPGGKSDAAALRRADAVMRDRGHVADRGDGEADRLQCAQSALAARTRTLDLNLEGADAVLGGLLAGVFRGHLSGVRSRLT